MQIARRWWEGWGKGGEGSSANGSWNNWVAESDFQIVPNHCFNQHQFLNTIFLVPALAIYLYVCVSLSVCLYIRMSVHLSDHLYTLLLLHHYHLSTVPPLIFPIPPYFPISPFPSLLFCLHSPWRFSPVFFPIPQTEGSCYFKGKHFSSSITWRARPTVKR